MSAIFISYRRDDSEGQAGRLFDELAQHFGHDAVFMDVAALTPGRDFRRDIDEHVASCGVLLAVIGRQWLNLREESGERRIDDPLDFVRLEVASALRRDIPVVPVLVQGARMPRAAELPEDLQPLVFRNAVSISHAMWESDVQVLVKALRGLLASAPPVGARPGAAQATPRPVSGAGPALGWRLGGGLAALAGLVLVGGALLWPRRLAVEDPHATLAAAPPAAGPQAAASAAPAPVPPASVIRPVPAPVAAAAPATPPATRPVTLPAPAVAPASAVPAPAPLRRLPPLAPRWRSAEFPAPNAGLLAYTITREGDPACASYDGRSCLWGVAEADLDFSRIKPLACGEPHRRLYGETGYENPRHWCNLALRRPRDSR